MSPDSRSGEHGSALVMAVMFMSLLTALGIALLFLTQMNLEMNRTMLNTKQSFYLAESGIEGGRQTLFALNLGADDFGPRLVSAAGSNGVVDFNPAAIQAVYGSDGEFTGFTGYGDDAPLAVASSVGDGYYAAFLSNDPVDGRAVLADSNARVIVTGVGVGPNHSFEVVEAIIEPDVNLPPLPASVITLMGSSPTFVGGASGSEKYRGDDCHFLGGGDPALDMPIIGVMTDDAETDVEGGMSGDPMKYTSGSYDGDETAVNLNDAADPLLAGTGMGTMDANWQNCAYLRDLLVQLKKYSTIYCAGSCVLGATTKDDLTFIEGDLVIGPGQHLTGMLVVTGSLEINGSSSFAGVILVIGEGSLLRNGGGSGVLSGSTIVADIAGANNIYGDADDCQPVPPSTDPFGDSHYEVNGGGNTDIDYCTRFLYTQPRSYIVSDFRQF